MLELPVKCKEENKMKIEIEEDLIQEILDFIRQDAIYMFDEYGGYDYEKDEESQMPELWHKVNALKVNK
jgi:hypothetical protein